MSHTHSKNQKATKLAQREQIAVMASILDLQRDLRMSNSELADHVKRLTGKETLSDLTGNGLEIIKGYLWRRMAGVDSCEED